MWWRTFPPPLQWTNLLSHHIPRNPSLTSAGAENPRSHKPDWIPSAYHILRPGGPILTQHHALSPREDPLKLDQKKLLISLIVLSWPRVMVDIGLRTSDTSSRPSHILRFWKRHIITYTRLCTSKLTYLCYLWPSYIYKRNTVRSVFVLLIIV